jgi:2-polyprenyl-6-methoxyphenol hydroxylase-like FAD-dependent oxidoreductase
VNVVCIGGGPAGLYLGILLKLRDPRHRVVVYERNRPDDTFGFGVVFSLATLGHLDAADPVSYAAIARQFTRWEDIEISVHDQVLRSTGHGFCGLERNQLLLILQRRAAELGVELHFEQPVESLHELAWADVIVACDGVSSWMRDAHAAELGPSVDVRPNKFVWLGTTVPYRAFTFLFKDSRFGLFRIHAYPFSAEKSTFIVECRHDTWLRAGFDQGDEDHTVAVLEAIFADELDGHRLIKNRSIWRNFPTVRCQSWHTGKLVIVGDAAHTAHFSIGSGTKLAMEDSIELSSVLAEVREPATPAAISAALSMYQERRKPEVEALQAAAQASLEWFEGTERVMALAPAQFAYHLMTRSLRVSHASMRKRDPELARAVEMLLGDGVVGVAPRHTPLALGGHRLTTRLVVDRSADRSAGITRQPGYPDSVAGPDGSSVTTLLCLGDRFDVGIARGIATLAAHAPTGAALSDWLAALPAWTWRNLVAVVARCQEELAVLRAAAPADVVVGLELVDEPAERAQRVQKLALHWATSVPTFALVRPAAGLHEASRDRLAAVPFADLIRNHFSLPTVVCVDATARGEDLDAIIAAGRADLVVVPVTSAVFVRSPSA